MESWTCATEEKSYLFSDEMDFSVDAFMRSRKALAEWNDKSSFNYGKDGLISDMEGVKSMEFVDLGYTDLFQNSFQGTQPLETSCCKLDSNSSRRANSSTHVIALDSSLDEEDESVSKHSSSLVESKSPGSLLIDLKLGRLVDCKDASGDKTVKDVLTFSSTHTTMLAKRARTSSTPTQKPVCQVYGCNMDLSSSKEYHKRHRVCDVHSKTAKVIVNGIEQRFCQQCSRFHLLAEFDDGKRSCRRRLAGHNERRRKPQCDYISGKPHRMPQLYQGATYLGASLQKKPQFAFQDIIFHGGIFYPGKYEETNQSEHIKLEEESIYSPQLSVPITHDQDLSKASKSSCALSLLSAQSQDLSCHPVGNPTSSSLGFQHSNTHHSGCQVSEILPGISSMDKKMKNKSFSYGINSVEVFKNGGITHLDPNDALQGHGDDSFQPSELSHVEYHFPPEHSATVDLFQLSSHLQRVQQQRDSFVLKKENEDYCCFPTV